MVWECSQECTDEHFGKILDGFDIRKATNVAEFLKTQSTPSTLTFPEILDISQSWVALVREYRSRAITKSEDRIIAMAGTAQAIHNITKLTYLAGSWAECFPLGFLWYICDSGLPKPLPRQTAFTPTKAPSWSWFSVGINIPRFELDSHDSGKHTWSLGNRFLSIFKHNWSPGTRGRGIYQARIFSFQWPAQPRNELPPSLYYDFHGLQVTIRTQVTSTDLRVHGGHVEAGRVSKEVYAMHGSHNIMLENIQFICQLDDRGQEHELLNDVLLSLFTEVQILDEDPDSLCMQKLAGLALVPGSESGTWRRIGVWSLNIDLRADDPVVSERLSIFEQLQDVRSELITLI
jgi:hypothetical protein